MAEDDTSLRGRVALVTGAGRGIGRAIAEMLAEEGCNVALVARTAEELIETASICEEYGIETLVMVTDVTDPGELTRAFERCHDEFRRLDILINNAGMIDFESPFAVDPELWDQVVDVNLRASMRASRLALPYLLNSSRPAIIFIGSLASREAFASQAAYVASKQGLLGFGQSLFADVRDRGIKVCTVSPGLVETQLTDAFDADREKMLFPEDVADAVRYVLKTPNHVCPTELTLQPQYAPYD
jgi:3-oxoacyl-[acyl-carrier protein] reductase